MCLSSLVPQLASRFLRVKSLRLISRCLDWTSRMRKKGTLEPQTAADISEEDLIPASQAHQAQFANVSISHAIGINIASSSRTPDSNHSQRSAIGVNNGSGSSSSRLSLRRRREPVQQHPYSVCPLRRMQSRENRSCPWCVMTETLSN